MSKPYRDCKVSNPYRDCKVSNPYRDCKDADQNWADVQANMNVFVMGNAISQPDFRYGYWRTPLYGIKIRSNSLYDLFHKD